MSEISMRLEGQVALVTGSSRGIGKAIALAFAEQGADLILTSSQSMQALNEVAQAIMDLSRRCLSIQTDVSQKKSVQALFRAIDESFDRLDILVNNAGIIRRGTLESMAEGDWEAVLDVNLTGTFHCCKEAAERMKTLQRGKIINISSVAGKLGDITSAPGYGPSKAAIDNLTKTLAMHLAPHNINVNAIAPHAIETEMSAQWSEEKRKSIVESIPLKRLGKPEEVADAALFLASEDSNFITGEILDINGGFLMD
jgi:3-oxoacyl-[acyl-carrier protein] reductase